MKPSPFLAMTLPGLMLLALALALPAQAADNHYRWTDDEGKTMYSDRPPPGGVDYEIVSSKARYSRAVDGAEGARRADDTAQGEGGNTSGDSAAAERERKKEWCDKARTNLEALSGSARIVVRTPDGGQRELSDDEIATQRDTARSQIRAYCD